jgi:hypothetical protein
MLDEAIDLSRRQLALVLGHLVLPVGDRGVQLSVGLTLLAGWLMSGVFIDALPSPLAP